MADNQRKKLTESQIRQREQIGIFIEKAKGKGISEVISEAFPKNKGTYYDNVVKIPLRGKFIELLKEKIGVDISGFNTERIQEKPSIEGSGDYYRDKYNEALKENEALFNKNRELKDTIADKKKLIDHYEGVIESLKQEITELKKQA